MRNKSTEKFSDAAPAGVMYPRAKEYGQHEADPVREAARSREDTAVSGEPVKMRSALRVGGSVRGQILFVVARHQPQIHDYLVRSLSGADCAEVVMDRRSRERRQEPALRPTDRRRGDRRSRPHEPAQFYPLGYTIVHQRRRGQNWLRRLTSIGRRRSAVAT